MLKTLFSLNRGGAEVVALKEATDKFAVVYGMQVLFFRFAGQCRETALTKAAEEFHSCCAHFISAEFGCDREEHMAELHG